jgi:hypothetical protein
MSSSSIYEIILTISSCINTNLHINEIEAIMMALVKDDIINNENVSSIRNQYLENIKWQNDNYNAVENWVLTHSKLSKIEMKKYSACREIHDMKIHITKRKKRKFCET